MHFIDLSCTTSFFLKITSHISNPKLTNQPTYAKFSKRFKKYDTAH